ncbi:MAG TPA: ATP-binding protein [Thermoanaerobaculia bacterium]|nr:ATP-binding protein [Thermoanaerobaculia bacterium]
MPYDEATALRALLASTPDLIYFLDREGGYQYIGEAAAAKRGAVDAMMQADRFHEQRLAVMEDRRALRDEIAADGAVLEYVIAPVIAGPDVLGTVVVTRDVSERRRAEAALRESEAKFSIAFDRSPLALTITSVEDGRLVEVNEGFVRLSGYSREEAIGSTPEQLGLWLEPRIRAARFERLRAGKAVPDIEARFRVKNGQELVGVIGSALVEINSRPCVLSSVIDITARKRAEEAKDDFLATLSHELRTPLTSGYGWVKLLLRMQEPELLENGLRAIEQSLVVQMRLVDDLLDVSRIAVGKVEIDLQPVDLGVIIESVVEIVRPSARAKQLDLRVDLQDVLTVMGDASRLRQIVWNLLVNAIKFTPGGGSVDVMMRRAGSRAEIVVRDTGEGIDPEFLPFVFDRFRQADSSINRTHGGLGIGLAIVSSLVAAHDGTVRAGSGGRGKGAEFVVTLPLLSGDDRQGRRAVRS